MPIQKNMIYFVELIIDQFGQVEVIIQTMIISLNFGELFNFCDSWDSLYFGYNDLLFLCDGSRLRFRLWVKTDHKFVFSSIKVIKNLLRIY